MKTVHQKLQRAFTLLEIMIAMTIFMVILVAVYSSWAAIVRGSRVGLTAAAEAQRARIAIHTIEDALLTTQLYTENLRYYNFIADTSDSKFAWLSLTARLPASFPGSGLFGDQVVRRVTFSVEPGPDGTKQLIMTQIPLLLVTNADVSAYPITLAKDVNLFVLEFWDTQLNDWTDELLTTNQIPKLVRISLGLGLVGNTHQPAEIASRIIAMPSVAVTTDIQQPARQPGGANGSGGVGGGGTRGGKGERGTTLPPGGQGQPGNGRFNPGSGGGRFTPGGPSSPPTVPGRQIPGRQVPPVPGGGRPRR